MTKETVQETCEKFVLSMLGVDITGMRPVKFPEIEYKEIEILTENGFKPSSVELLDNGNVLIKYERLVK